MERVQIRIGIPGEDSRKSYPKEILRVNRLREFLNIIFSTKVTEQILQELLNPSTFSSSNYVHIYCSFTQLGKYTAYRKEERFGRDFWIYPKIKEIFIPNITDEGYKIIEARDN